MTHREKRPTQEPLIRGISLVSVCVCVCVCVCDMFDEKVREDGEKKKGGGGGASAFYSRNQSMDGR